MTDTCGNLLAVNVHAANIHDTKAGGAVFKEACALYPSLQGVSADAGYRKTFEEEVRAIGKKVIIAEKLDPKKWTILPYRWVVERTFAWMGNHRRLAKDFENTIAASLSFIFLANASTIIKRVRGFRNQVQRHARR